MRLVYHDDYLAHNPGPFHPERRARLEAAIAALKEQGLWERCTVLSPKVCTRDDLLTCHVPELVDLIERESLMGGAIDMDTPVPTGTHTIACRAVGGGLLAAREVVKRNEPAFALLRPPGHHSERARACGFCYYNNVAIAAQRLLDDGLERVLVLDIDCHHGNGTQDIFYRSSDVFYISLHQDPRTLFPGSGFTHETGRGEGEGFTANVPLPPGTGDADFCWAFDKVFGKVYDSFRPEAVLVSVGLDTHVNDPLTSLEVTIPTYRHITRELIRRTSKLAFFLEGGYDLDAMGNGVAAIVKECLGEHEDDTEVLAQVSPCPRVKGTVEELLEQLN